MSEARLRYADAAPAVDGGHWRIGHASHRSGAAQRVDQSVSLGFHVPQCAIIGALAQAEKSDVRSCGYRNLPLHGGMELSEIRERMVARKIKVKDLAAHLGLASNKVSKIFAGERRITAAEMDKIRELLADQTATVGREIPIIGQVAAGNWKEAVRKSIASMPSPDPSVPPRAFALQVDGDSMDDVVDDGGTIIVDPEDKALFSKRFYVVLDADGETTFKQYQEGPARLVPRSSNPSHKEILIGSGDRYEIVGRVIWRASRM
jgi:repressor LexA